MKPSSSMEIEVVLTGILLGLWWLVSLLGQFPPFLQLKNRINFLGIFPTWAFFTNPLLVYDLQLAVKVQPGDRVVWRAVDLGEGRRLWDFLWNPRRRLKKALIDANAQVVQARLQGNRRLIPQTAAFQMLSDYLRHRYERENPVALRVEALKPGHETPLILWEAPLEG